MIYKAVFCDIDGTLLTSDLTVSPATRDAVVSLSARGIHFVIASGRSPSGIYPILKKYSLHVPMITCSGALILDEDGGIIFEKGIDESTAGRFIEYVERRGFPLTWCLYTKDEWYVKDKSDPRVIKEERIIESEAVAGSLASCRGKTIHKILCICDPEYTAAIEADLRVAFTTLNPVRSSDILIEVMMKDVNKAASVEWYCGHIGISACESVAFGDNYNDIEMLEAVGLGVLMGNAPDELKRRFPDITLDNDHDGIPHAVKRIFE